MQVYPLLLLVMSLLSSLSPITAAATSTDAPPFIIRNVRIFDGEKTIDADSVTVSDGKITAVGRDLPAPHGVQVIDGTGDTLLPGLIDSHVHLWNHDELKQALVFGNTTVLDMFMWWQLGKRWKEEELQGASDIADFRTAGFGFATPGGHGNENPSADTTITRPEQAQAKVDERIKQGSDYIKIFYENGPRFPAMPKDVMEAIVKAAHKRGKMAIVHGTSLDIVNAGADGLAHLPIAKLAEPQWRDALKTHHMFVITTMTFTDFHLTPGRLAASLPDDPRMKPYLGPISLRALAEPQFHNSDTEHLSYADSETNLRTLREAGVPLLAGTDAADTDPIGALLHVELELMVKAGISPAEALADATSVPARIFSLTDRGRIAPDLRADLLLVHGDPTTDIRKTRDIVAIWKQGVRVNREKFQEEIAERNAAWSLGPGWIPVSSEQSSVHIQALESGNKFSRRAIVLTGEVKPASGFLFAGAEYSPTLQYDGASDDISGTPGISFRARGDGKTYTVSLFDQTGNATTRYFVAGKNWSDVAFRFSDFGSDGKNVARIQIASSVLGPFHLELADAHMGAHRWMGMDLKSLKDATVYSVNVNSPAQRAGLKSGDVITAFDRKPVHRYADLMALLSATHVHDQIPLEIIRDGKTQAATIEIGERPDEVAR
jgi:imidazolonepropionase-like amidohydrolase